MIKIRTLESVQEEFPLKEILKSVYNRNVSFEDDHISINDKQYLLSTITQSSDDVVADTEKQLLGGGAVWNSGYIFDVSTLTYKFYSPTKEAPATQVELSEADADDDRIDAICIDQDGVVLVVEGTPAPTPATPDVSAYILVQYVLVTAATTEPVYVENDETIYNENIEWTGSTYDLTASQQGTINFDYAVNPFTGTKCTRLLLVTRNRAAKFSTLSSVAVNDFSVLTLRVLLEAALPNGKFVQLFISQTNNTPIGLPINLSSYGLNPSLANVWQTIVIPMSAFTAGTSFNQLFVYVNGGTATDKRTICIDYIKLTGGYSIAVTPTPVEYLEEISYANLVSKKNAGNLQAGKYYKITNKGDQGIVLQALSTSTLSQKGVRFMNCPITYETTGLFLGVWHAGLTPAAGEKVIWAGKVWTNTSGAVGTADDDLTLNAAHYTVIAKPAYGATNANYTTIQFGIIYDFENDWIAKQWDKYNNVLGLDYSSEQIFYAFGYNPVDISDWNMATNPANIFAMNNCVGIYNNAVGGTIERNICAGIYENTCSGNIRDNNISSQYYIARNSCSDINYNANQGDIYGNTNGDVIAGNSNKGRIADNSNTTHISSNSNNGDILNNSNGSFIANNSNNGNIEYNSNSGAIGKNRNNGIIETCAAPCVNVINNINNGYIQGYTTVGDLSDASVNK